MISAASLHRIAVICHYTVATAQFVINGFAASRKDGILFVNTTAEISEKHDTVITPSGWTFSIWGFIYVWQGCWQLYSMARSYTREREGFFFHISTFQPASFIFVCTVISALNIGWLVAFSHSQIELSFAILLLYTILMWVAFYLCHRHFYLKLEDLRDEEQHLDIWFTRILVHNGVGIQTAWVTIATVLNLVMLLPHNSVMSKEGSGIAGIVIILFVHLFFGATDMCKFDSHTRYTITPYIVVVVALVGSYTKMYDTDYPSSIIKVITLGMSSLLLCVKLCMAFFGYVFRNKCPYIMF